MGITVDGLPYPEPTDPVAGGAAAIRNLAEKTDERLIRIGLVSVAFDAANAYGRIYFAKPFPAGRTPWAIFQVYNAGNTAYQRGAGTATYVDLEAHRIPDGLAPLGNTFWVAYIAGIDP